MNEALDASPNEDLSPSEINDSSPDADKERRPLIRPKLKKREIGVSLTESKPNPHSPRGPKAPRPIVRFPSGKVDFLKF